VRHMIMCSGLGLAKTDDIFIPCAIECRMEQIASHKDRSDGGEGDEDGHKGSAQRG
jgi:hypothetical protein